MGARTPTLARIAPDLALEVLHLIPKVPGPADLGPLPSLTQGHVLQPPPSLAQTPAHLQGKEVTEARGAAAARRAGD